MMLTCACGFASADIVFCGRRSPNFIILNPPLVGLMTVTARDSKKKVPTFERSGSSVFSMTRITIRTLLWTEKIFRWLVRREWPGPGKTNYILIHSRHRHERENA